MPTPQPEITTIKDLMERYYGGSRLNLGQRRALATQMNMIRKTDAPIITSTTGWYTAVYGRKVWLTLNQQANLFGCLPKIPWGEESGWRVVTARPASTAHGVNTDTSSLPDTVKPTVVEVKAEPKYFPTDWDASLAQQLRSKRTGGIGDLNAWMREYMGIWHREMINVQMFTSGGVVTNQSVDFESLDRIVASYAELSAYEADQSSSFSTSDLDPYDTSLFNRDAGATVWDAQVSCVAKTGLRNLTLDLLDENIMNIRKAGGNPKVIITGYDTLRKIKALYEGYWRIQMPADYVVPSLNGVQGVAGVKVGTNVAFYDGIPIIPDKDCLIDTGGISRIYILDTDYLAFKTDLPTAYFVGGMVQGDPFGLGTFMTEGMYLTGGELVCTDFQKQGKIRDLQ